MFIGNVDNFVCVIYVCATGLGSNVCSGRCLKLFYIVI